MKTLLLLFALLLVINLEITAQVAINNDGSSPDNSAMLDVKSSASGILIPRMTLSQIESISNPANGLLIYCTDNNKFYFFENVSNRWKEIAIGTGVIPTSCGTVTDACGNTYSTVVIYSQCWMAKNLATTKFNDGSNILHFKSITGWDTLTHSAYCWYGNDSTSYASDYGSLYNWYAVNTGILCPTGWHVPDSAEWATLVSNYGGPTVAGGKLKEAGYSHWIAPNTGATNESSFTGLPGGNRYMDFLNMGYNGWWWSATESTADMSYYLRMFYNNDDTNIDHTFKSVGSSVRCVKD